MRPSGNELAGATSKELRMSATRLPSLTITSTALAVALAALLVVPAAQAAFPGRNGRLVIAAPPGDHPPLGWLRTMNPQGGEVRSLAVDTATEDSGPVWSPDGGRLAFVSDSSFSWEDGGDRDIFTSDAAGSSLRRLTRTPELEGSPTWSPDGRRLAFTVTSALDAPRPVSEIWVMNADGTDRRRLSAPGASDHNPAWSPGGWRIAFASDRADSREIYTMDTRGGDVRRVTADGDLDDQPTWSPDGRRLAWVSDLETFTGAEIYEADALSGRAAVRRTNNDVPDREPAFSPDGRWIAFTTQCRSGSCEDHEVWRITREGADPRFLADGVSADWQRLR